MVAFLQWQEIYYLFVDDSQLHIPSWLRLVCMGIKRENTQKLKWKRLSGKWVLSLPQAYYLLF